MRTVYLTATSIDGFIADRKHSLDWLFESGPELSSTSFPELISSTGALAMGSSTYEWLLEHEIKPGSAEEKPWPYSQPSWIFTSRRLPVVPNADVQFVSGDVKPVHDEMKRRAGAKKVWIVGGGDLAGQFHDAGRLDDIVLMVVPVTLGEGFPVFPRESTRPPFNLVSVRHCGNSVELHYQCSRVDEDVSDR